MLPGCGLLGDDDEDFDDVPRERLVAMVAIYSSQEEPAHRLVVADFEDPERHKILRKAGDAVSIPCFSPDKRHLLFADHARSTVGSRASLKLYDLETDRVQALENAPTATTHGGTSVRCVWDVEGKGLAHVQRACNFVACRYGSDERRRFYTTFPPNMSRADVSFASADPFFSGPNLVFDTVGAAYDVKQNTQRKQARSSGGASASALILSRKFTQRAYAESVI